MLAYATLLLRLRVSLLREPYYCASCATASSTSWVTHVWGENAPQKIYRNLSRLEKRSKYVAARITVAAVKACREVKVAVRYIMQVSNTEVKVLMRYKCQYGI